MDFRDAIAAATPFRIDVAAPPTGLLACPGKPP